MAFMERMCRVLSLKFCSQISCILKNVIFLHMLHLKKNPYKRVPGDLITMCDYDLI